MTNSERNAALRNYWAGLSPEARAARTLAANASRSKPVEVLNLDTNEREVFPSAAAASRRYRVSQTSLCRWLTGDRVQPADGGPVSSHLQHASRLRFSFTS